MKHTDKLKHLAVFSVGYFAVLTLAANLTPMGFGAAVFVSNLVLAVAAFVTEDMQSRQPGRVKDGWDAYADMLATVVGFGTYLVAEPFIHKLLGTL